MKLLEKWIESVRAVRDRPQDIGDETLRSPATSQPEFGLTTEQMRDIQLALVEDCGEFATHREMAEIRKKFGQ
jgi:hypothetical protein